jgi:hypothetical protein
MKSKQKYFPDFGYSSPHRTKQECANPAFADSHLHRIGIFAEEYLEDGLPGYSCIHKCVNCGKVFKDKIFIPNRRPKSVI